MPYAFQFQVIFKIRFFTIDTASYTSLSPHKGFSAFLRRLFRKISMKIVYFIYSRIFIFFLLSAFQPINYITFVLFHGFREHCKHKRFSHDDSRCCLVLYIFANLNLLPDILSQKCDSMIHKSFYGVENIISYPIHTDVV